MIVKAQRECYFFYRQPGGFQLCFRVHDNNLRDDCQRTVSACSSDCTREMRCSNSTLFCIKCHFMLTGIMCHQQLYKLPVQLLLSSQRFVKLPAIAFIQVLSFPVKNSQYGAYYVLFPMNVEVYKHESAKDIHFDTSRQYRLAEK